MKQHQSLGLVAVMAVVAGLTGVTALGDISFVENDVSSLNKNIPISGHLIIQVTDDEGNIKNYMQTDNVITSNAKRCTGNLLFGAGLGTCVSSSSPFDEIVLSPDSFADDAATAELADAGFSNQLSTFGLAKSTSNTVTEGSASSGTGSQRIDIAHTFSYSGTSASQLVTSAALMNASVSVFAIKDFPSPVTLNNGDDLTVTWQITLG